MNVVVCAKQIPDPAAPGELDPQSKTLKREGKLILDDSDAYGVEMGLQLADKAGGDEVEAPLPAIVSVTAGVVEPRYPSFKGIMAAKNKPVDEVKVADLGVSNDEVGWPG